MMKIPARLTILSILLVCAICAHAYNLDWMCVSSGGSSSMTSSSYGCMLTSGQPVSGISGSSGYKIFLGFWQPMLVGLTDVEEIGPPDVPIKFSLEQNYPNPFNPTTAVEFSLPRSGNARLKIYDILGRLVTVLVDESLPAGAYRVFWDGRDLDGKEVASGIFLYRLETSNLATTKKMLLLRSDIYRKPIRPGDDDCQDLKYCFLVLSTIGTHLTCGEAASPTCSLLQSAVHNALGLKLRLSGRTGILSIASALQVIFSLNQTDNSADL